MRIEILLLGVLMLKLIHRREEIFYFFIKKKLRFNYILIQRYSNFLCWEGLYVCLLYMKYAALSSWKTRFISVCILSLFLSVQCILYLVSVSIHKIFHSCSVHVNRTTTIQLAYCLCFVWRCKWKATPQLLFLFRWVHCYTIYTYKRRKKAFVRPNARIIHLSFM